jgi:hypothetical protein
MNKKQKLKFLKDIKNIAPFIIGFSILFYIFHSIGFHKIFSLFSRIKVEYFFLASIFYFFTDVCMALALREAIITTKKKISLWKIIPSQMCGMFYSAITPGRVGYYYTAFSLAKKTKISRSETIGFMTLIQGIYFFIKIFACLLAVIYFSSFMISPESKTYLILVSLAPFLFVFAIALVLYTKIINKILSRIPLLKNFLRYVELMQEASKLVKKKKIFNIVLIGTIGWFIMSFQWFLISKALNLNITYLTAIMLNPLLTTIMFIPISPGGLGLAEGGSSLLFKILNFTLADGAAFMLLIRLNNILVDFLGIIDMKLHK